MTQAAVSEQEEISEGDGPTDPPAPGRPRRRLRRWLLVLLGLWLIGCGAALAMAARQAAEGVGTLTQARESLTPSGLLRGDGAGELRQARAQFASAHSWSTSWWLAPLRPLPVLGRQLASVRSLTGSAESVAAAGLRALDEFDDALEGDQTAGPARVRLAADVRAIADRAAATVEGVPLGPAGGLIAPLSTGRARFDRERADLVERLRSVTIGAAALRDFLQGPSRYLVLAANNAEMRAGSGMLLSAGLLRVEEGGLELDDMVPTPELRLPDGLVQPDGDLERRWGWTKPSVEWRNLAMTPRFDATAELAAQMWEARTGEAVDGVLVIDPFALRAILKATGPVALDGATVDAGNVVKELLLEQYRSYGDVPLDQYGSVGVTRRERLSVIARTALERLEQGGWDPATLIGELDGAARGRHVLMWSRHDAEQAGWRSVGVSGELSEDSALLAVLSQGGTKLDQFLNVQATVKRSGGTVTVEVDLENRTPEGLPRYVAGPSDGGVPGVGVPEGTYAGILSLNLPRAARNLTVVDGKPLVVGSDGATVVVSTRVRLGRWERTTVRFRFDLPRGTWVRVEPSARTPEVRWRAGGEDWWDTEARRVRF